MGIGLVGSFLFQFQKTGILSHGRKSRTMLPRMDVAWFDIRTHSFGRALPNPAQPDAGGIVQRVILTKPFDGPCMAAMILGLSPETNAGFRPTSTAQIVDHSKVQLRNDSESLKNYRFQRSHDRDR
jgi:hypothetical protein